MKNKFHHVLMAPILSAVFFLLVTPSRADQTGQSTEAYGLYLKAMVEENQGNLTNAEESLDKAMTMAPGSSYLHQAAAELAFRQTQYPKASEHIEKALALDSSSIKMHILAGQIYWALGEQEKAEAKLKRAVELGPDEAEALVNLAMAVTPKDPKRAIKLYNDYLVRHPAETEIQERVAQLYQNTGELEKAKTAWTGVLDNDPESIRAHLASAQIAEVQHDTMTAISHYESVLEQDPNNLPLLLRIGELRYRNDEMSQAYDAFSKAQSIAPTSASANFWLALIAESRGDWNEAVRLLKSVADKAPEPGVLLRLSFYYSQMGRQKEAIQLLKKLSDDEPENTDFLRYLSVAYEQNKEFSKALGVVDRLVAIDPENPDHYFHKATLHDRLNQHQKSEAALKKSIELDPQFHMALNYLGYSYAERNIQLDDAERLVSAALGLDPENGAYLDSMGWIYYRQGKYKKAEDFLKQATEDGRDALIWDHLGDAQAAQGSLISAMSSWETSLRMDSALTLVSKKIEKAMTRLTPAQKFNFYRENAHDDFSSLALLKGLSSVGVCQKGPCFEVKAEFEYVKDHDLTVTVPGPMGAPAMMLQKSSSTAAKFGSVDPSFLAVESFAVKAFNRIDSLLRGSAFTPANAVSLGDQAVSSNGELRSKSKDLEFVFDEKSGQIKEVIWGPTGATDRLKMKEKIKNSAPPLPSRIEWRDDAAGVTLKISFIKPVIKSTLTGPQKD